MPNYKAIQDAFIWRDYFGGGILEHSYQTLPAGTVVTAWDMWGGVLKITDTAYTKLKWFELSEEDADPPKLSRRVTIELTMNGEVSSVFVDGDEYVKAGNRMGPR